MMCTFQPKEFGKRVVFSSHGVTTISTCSCLVSSFKAWNKDGFSSLLLNVNDALTSQKWNIFLKLVSSCFTFFLATLCKKEIKHLCFPKTEIVRVWLKVRWVCIHTVDELLLCLKIRWQEEHTLILGNVLNLRWLLKHSVEIKNLSDFLLQKQKIPKYPVA